MRRELYGIVRIIATLYTELATDEIYCLASSSVRAVCRTLLKSSIMSWFRYDSRRKYVLPHMSLLWFPHQPKKFLRTNNPKIVQSKNSFAFTRYFEVFSFLQNYVLRTKLLFPSLAVKATGCICGRPRHKLCICLIVIKVSTHMAVSCLWSNGMITTSLARVLNRPFLFYFVSAEGGGLEFWGPRLLRG